MNHEFSREVWFRYFSSLPLSSRSLSRSMSSSFFLLTRVAAFPSKGKKRILWMKLFDWGKRERKRRQEKEREKEREVKEKPTWKAGTCHRPAPTPLVTSTRKPAPSFSPPFPFGPHSFSPSYPLSSLYLLSLFVFFQKIGKMKENEPGCISFEVTIDSLVKQSQLIGMELQSLRRIENCV